MVDGLGASGWEMGVRSWYVFRISSCSAWRIDDDSLRSVFGPEKYSFRSRTLKIRIFPSETLEKKLSLQK